MGDGGQYSTPLIEPTVEAIEVLPPTSR